VRPGRERDDDLRIGLFGDVEKPAELGIRIPELLDGRRAGERPEGRERRRHRREGVRLVHHHRDHDLAAGHACRPLA
jgi:hypothetical protein